VRQADLILLLDHGVLAAQGKHEELLRSSELYAEILDTQFGEHDEWLAMVEKETML